MSNAPTALLMEMKMAANLRNKLALTDDEIEARFDDLGYGVTVDDLAFVDTLTEEFRLDRIDWARPGNVVQDEDGVLEIRGAQPAQGQARRDVVIIDFGDVRAVMGATR